MFRKKKSSENLSSTSGAGGNGSSTTSDVSSSKVTTQTTASSTTNATQKPPQAREQARTTVPVTTSTTATTRAQPSAHPQTKTVITDAKDSSTAAPVRTQRASVVTIHTTSVNTSPKTVDKTARKAKGARGFFRRAPTVVGLYAPAAEAERLKEDKERTKNWKRWGPYLSERQWATVREDYSADGSW